MHLPDSSILTNIQVTGHTSLRDILFEKAYINTRSLENRLFTDEDLQKLPDVAETHTHFKEWRLRRRSARQLVNYLAARKRSPDILEVGCGNGWLSHQMAEIRGAEVIGLDINFTELQQAARVFSDDPNLHFIHGDIRSGILGERTFDYIVFAATMPYFPSLKKVLHWTLTYLKPGGEIHLIDSYLYRPEELEMQRRKTLAYYTSLGYPEMADFYFHHSLTDLRSFHHEWIRKPHSMMNRVWGIRTPWPWIRIKNN